MKEFRIRNSQTHKNTLYKSNLHTEKTHPKHYTNKNKTTEHPHTQKYAYLQTKTHKQLEHLKKNKHLDSEYIFLDHRYFSFIASNEMHIGTL